jgi:aminopeptidase YwaD
MFKGILNKIRTDISGEAAFNHVVEIAGYHRIQVSPGIRAAVNYCVNTWKNMGIDAKVVSWPSTGKEYAWGSQMIQEWSCDEAELKLVEPINQSRVLANFQENKMSIIQRSLQTSPEGVIAEVIILNKGEEESDYKGLDVAGKVVLTSGDVQRVHELAVEERGAIGIICDGMFYQEPNRREGDIDDALKYTSFWWSGGEKPVWGFVLSPRNGRWLRRLIQESKTPVKVHAKVKSKLYPGTMEDAVAKITGKTKEEVTIIAHVCHPQQSANDNASGCGAVIEASRILNKLIQEEKIPKPKRSIAFTLVPEMAGTYPWLAENEKRLHEMIAALNLDMVGENQLLTGGPHLIERTPDSTPSFVNSLLESIIDVVKFDVKNGSPTNYPLFKFISKPFGGGSDHYIYSDPSVGIPCPTIGSLPDKFYHTSFDTLDKVDPEMLRRIALITATYAYFIADAGEKEALWLASETAYREKIRLIQKIVENVNNAVEADADATAIILGNLRDRVDYWTQRASETVKSVKIIDPKNKNLEKLIEQLSAEMIATGKTEKKKAEANIQAISAAKGLGTIKAKKKRLLKADKEAEKIIVKRVYLGPFSTRPFMKSLAKKEREAWREYGKKHPAARGIITTSMFWCDGKRTLLEVSKLCKNEIGSTDTEYLLEYYRIMEKAGLVKIITVR